MNSDSQQKRTAATIMTCAYGLLIVYASLFPLSGWRAPNQPLFSFLGSWPSEISRADLLTNVVAYVPLGALLVWALRMRPAVAVWFAVAIGALLSLSMETLQMFVPGRTSSPVDLITNIAGTSVGAIVASCLKYRPRVLNSAISLRENWFAPGPAVHVSLIAVLLWVCSQWSPFVPSMDVSSIRGGLAPAWHTLRDPSLLEPYRAIAYGFNVGGIAVVLILCGRSRPHFRLLVFVGMLAVFAIKPLIVTRQLSLEEIIGFAIGSTVLLLPWRRNAGAILVAAFIFTAFAALELRPATGSLHSFNWIPFQSEIDDTVNGFGAIFDAVWPFAVLGALRLLYLPNLRRTGIVAMTLVLAGVVFGFEWHQQYVPGRFGDVTTVLLAMLGWFSPVILYSRIPHLHLATAKNAARIG